MHKKPILILDGLNVFMRHFCANPAMSENGDHVGGTLGFLKGLGNLCEQFCPHHVIVVWESGGNARKRAVMKTYKMGRRPPGLNRYYEDDIPATSSNHTWQVSLLAKVLGHLPITQIYVRDCEADDVIGYLSKYTYDDSETIVVSSDKDLYQLINNTHRQWSPGQKKLIDSHIVLQKFGISPENFVTARVFIGDSSDNIKGIKGVGFKNLSKWFPVLANSNFVSHSEIITQAQELMTIKRGKTIAEIAGANITADRNWKLMYLDTNRLSATQIQKIEGQLENIGKSDKMSLLRLFIRNGMQKFDINRHFAAINSVRKM